MLQQLRDEFEKERAGYEARLLQEQQANAELQQ
jgi:hypothetical protein